MLLFWANFECPGNHFGGYFGAILVILAVRASIWTPRASPNAIYRQITTHKWNYGALLGLQKGVTEPALFRNPPLGWYWGAFGGDFGTLWPLWDCFGSISPLVGSICPPFQ